MNTRTSPVESAEGFDPNEMIEVEVELTTSVTVHVPKTSAEEMRSKRLYNWSPNVIKSIEAQVAATMGADRVNEITQVTGVIDDGEIEATW